MCLTCYIRCTRTVGQVFVKKTLREDLILLIVKELVPVHVEGDMSISLNHELARRQANLSIDREIVLLTISQPRLRYLCRGRAHIHIIQLTFQPER